MIDFANILFAGPCNRSCWFCIGKQLPQRVNRNNLNRFPPDNLEALVEAVNRLNIGQIVFTGTVTDPQLYRHQARLLQLLRSRLTTGAHYSLHTNGALALRQMEVFNRYDKACISFPSFNRNTYARMMGSTRVPDLAAIVQRARIPIKVSCLISPDNLPEIDGFLEGCRALGLTRVVLRRLYGETRDWPILVDRPVARYYRGNPVYNLGGLEVTYWNFDSSQSTSINLFPDGTLGRSYLLAQTPQLRAG